MILVARRAFTVSRYHRRVSPEMAASPLARGPVLRVRVRFEWWMEGRPIEADAFVDPGADETIFSLRWIAEQGGKGARARPWSFLAYPGDPDSGLLDEGATIEIGGRALELGMTQPVRLLSQGTPASVMNGFEDILLGRDFFAAHGLLFVLDGQDESFSLLLPADDDNQQRRKRILAELSPHPI